MQNIYDDPEFFRGYADQRERSGSLNELLDLPTIRALLPALRGKDVVDLGCGMGPNSEYAAEQGARSVLGLDISEKMLAQALRRNPAPEVITYARLPIEEFEGDAQFDVALSSLALHYIAGYRDLVVRIAAALRPGGHFIFSVEHPVLTSKGGYRDEGERRNAWIVENVLGYHRTFSGYVQPLIESGFLLERVVEPGVPADFENQDFFPPHSAPFLYIRSRKA